MKYYIGIDMGTTHIKTAVFLEEGTLKLMLRAHTPQERDEYGVIYRPESLWGIVCGQLNEALAMVSVRDEVMGISVTGMAEAGLIVDRRSGREETNIIPWFDKRTEELAGALTEEEEKEGFYATGLRNSYKYGIYKFAWLLERNPEWKENGIWLSVCDYIVYKLTGRMVTDPGLAVRTYAWDIGWKRLRSGILKKYGLTEVNFPEVLESGKAAGPVNAPDIHTAGRRIPAAVAGHDHVCAAYAVCTAYEGIQAECICNSAGTAETYVGIRPEGKITEMDRRSGMVIGPYADGNHQFWLANISSSGQSVEWARTRLHRTEIPYGELNQAVAECAAGPTGILYYPYLAGMGTPLFDSALTGAFLGLTAMHTWKEICKAVMEGTAYQSRYILKDVPEEDVLVCVGGAAQSAPWMQLKADITGREILVPDLTEATLLGAAALFAGKNYGEQECKRMLSRVYENAIRYIPDPQHTGEYTKTYERFLAGLDWITGQSSGRQTAGKDRK